MIRIRPYKAAGFSDAVLDTTEKYFILGEEWKCREMVMENPKISS